MKKLYSSLALIATLATGPTFADPLQDLSGLAAETVDAAMKRRLQTIAVEFAAEREKNNEQIGYAARDALRVGGILCQRINGEKTVPDNHSRQYADTVVGTGHNFSAEVLGKQKNLLTPELRDQGDHELPSFVEVFYQQVLQYNTSGVNRELWKKECTRM